MKFTKPSAGLIEEFKAATRDIPGAMPRKMFGYDCIFVNGNFAAGLWRDTCVFKLADEDAARLVAETGAAPFAPMKKRVMRGWWEVSEEVSHDPEQLAKWCERAAAYARSLPPKVKPLKAMKAKAGGAKRPAPPKPPKPPKVRPRSVAARQGRTRSR